MNKKKVLAINAILFAILFSLISLNKELLRPSFANSELIALLLGCFPNFLAAYLISLSAVTAVLIRKLKNGRLIVYAAAFIVFVMLMIEELMPMWGASTHYDIFDIIASGVGSTLTIITYEFLLLFIKKLNKRKINTVE